MKVAIIGCGVMGGAFARALKGKNELFLVTKDEKKGKELALELKASCKSLEESIKLADVLLLAVKPKDLVELSKKMQPFVKNGQIILSVITGASLALLHSLFPHQQCVRTMPSLPIVCGNGIIGVVEGMDGNLRSTISNLLQGVGLVYFLPESKMDGFTALCGSAPAFILVLLEAMMEGGVTLGFSFADANKLVLATFEGAIELLKSSGKHPAALKMEISSPAGTTIAGLNAMEEHGVRSALIATLTACSERSKQISKEYK